ncbi:MAG: Fic family protein [Pseudomonadota bacterium]|nr:Fic family protein [Pseudomonadota bacterium]
MRLPRHAPSLKTLINSDPEALITVFASQTPIDAEVSGEYLHWDLLRSTPPKGLSTERWWLSIKFARNAGRQSLDLLDKSGKPFSIALSDSMLRRLHFLDREAAGNILGITRGEDQELHKGHLIRSLIEEAMTSSQLEGASTTRVVAKEMLRTGRAPRDRSESMIFNNYHAMRQIQQWYGEPLTLEKILDIHQIICGDTLDDPTCVGRFRRRDEAIQVYDRNDGTLLHDPPPAHELEARIKSLCTFANSIESNKFLHPIVRAICLHFQIGHDHPFVDGNGRVARALFYWAMGRSGYWLTQFLSISSVLRKAPKQYALAYLWTEDDESDLGYFVDHQLRVLELAVEGFRGYVKRKTEVREQAKRLLKANSKLAAMLNHRQRALLLHALKNPTQFYRIAEHQGIHQVSYQTARSDLLDLAGMNFVRKVREGKAFAFQAVPELAKRMKLDQ